MKKLIGVLGIVLILVGSIFVMPVIGNEIEEENSKDLGIRWKILYVIGRVIYNLEAKLIHGYAIIGYVGGEIITFGNIYIEYEGVQARAVVLKSFIILICLFVFPELIVTTIAPIF